MRPPKTIASGTGALARSFYRRRSVEDELPNSSPLAVALDDVSADQDFAHTRLEVHRCRDERQQSPQRHPVRGGCCIPVDSVVSRARADRPPAGASLSTRRRCGSYSRATRLENLDGQDPADFGRRARVMLTDWIDCSCIPLVPRADRT